MTLHRKHPNSGWKPVRLTYRDQLDLQRIVLGAVQLMTLDRDAPGPMEFRIRADGHIAQQILFRHGVDVSLDEHTGRVTFNPEVVDA